MIGVNEPGTAVMAQRSSPRPWLLLSVLAAALAFAGNIIGLLSVDGIYGETYPALTIQAVAQDLADFFVVAPLIVISAIAVHRGSMGAYFRSGSAR